MPDLVVSKMPKALRPGKVLIDQFAEQPEEDDGCALLATRPQSPDRRRSSDLGRTVRARSAAAGLPRGVGAGRRGHRPARRTSRCPRTVAGGRGRRPSPAAFDAAHGHGREPAAGVDQPGPVSACSPRTGNRRPNLGRVAGWVGRSGGGGTGPTGGEGPRRACFAGRELLRVEVGRLPRRPGTRSHRRPVVVPAGLGPVRPIYRGQRLVGPRRACSITIARVRHLSLAAARRRNEEAVRLADRPTTRLGWQLADVVRAQRRHPRLVRRHGCRRAYDAVLTGS